MWPTTCSAITDVVRGGGSVRYDYYTFDDPAEPNSKNIRLAWILGTILPSSDSKIHVISLGIPPPHGFKRIFEESSLFSKQKKDVLKDDAGC